jgi:SAM-dependent methyltransferase
LVEAKVQGEYINREWKHKDLPLLNALKTWYEQPAGIKVAAMEAELLANILPMMFGYYLLQLSDHSPASCLTQSPILRQTCISPDALHDWPGSHVQGSYTDLPFLADSVDVIFLPHVLEFSEHPEKILQEAWRVLIPEGHLIITGFNPWSLFGLWRRLKHKPDTLPWNGKFLSMYKLRRMLEQFGAEVTEEKTIFFRPPLENALWLKKLRFLEIVGEYCCPYAGGAYLLVAKKKVSTLTPIKSAWSVKKIVVKDAYIEPSARSYKHK